jgi:hypothetical protein
MVVNSASLQSTLSMMGGERGTKIPYQMFLDEELEIKKNPSRTRDHTRN